MKFYKPIFFLTGLILLSVVVYYMTLWMIVAGDETKPFEQMKVEYDALLPSFLRRRVVLELFNISLLLIAAFLFYKCIKANFLKIICWVMISLCGILAYWNLFSLM